MGLALENYQTTLAVITNNIANADTPAYKRLQVMLVDNPYEDKLEAGVEDSSGRPSPAGLSVGAGSRIAGTQVDFRQGRLRHTGREWDLAVEGEGFFQVKDPGGAIYYCRGGDSA